MFDDLGGKIGRIGRRSPFALGVGSQEDLGTEPGRLDRPAPLQPQNMGGVAGRESGQQHNPAIDQAPQRPHRRRPGHERRHRLRSIAKAIPDGGLRRIETGLPRIERPLANCEPSRMADGLARARLFTQGCQRRGMLMSQKAERHQAARADDQAMLLQPHFAVAAQAESMDADGFDHRTESADRRAIAIQHRPPAGEECDVAGGPAHVGDEDIALAGEIVGADNAGGRAGEDGLDRAFHGDGRFDEGSVALDHHQGRPDAAFRQQGQNRAHELLQLGDEAGVEGAGQGPSGRIEL